MTRIFFPSLLAGSLCLIAVLSGCQNPNHLDGLVEGVDLDFDRVRAYWINQELVVAYERKQGSYRVGDQLHNQVVRLVFLTDRKELAGSEEILYTGREVPSALLVDHYAIEEDTVGMISQAPNFPPYGEVRVYFDKLGREPGESLVGNFHCSFAANMTVFGDFNLTLRDP